jgi:hypothetical protein
MNYRPPTGFFRYAQSKDCTVLLDDLWQALLKINDHINALHIVQLSSECFEKKSRLSL